MSEDDTKLKVFFCPFCTHSFEAKVDDSTMYLWKVVKGSHCYCLKCSHCHRQFEGPNELTIPFVNAISYISKQVGCSESIARIAYLANGEKIESAIKILLTRRHLWDKNDPKFL